MARLFVTRMALRFSVLNRSSLRRSGSSSGSRWRIEPYPGTEPQTPNLLLGVVKCGNCGGQLYRQQYSKKGYPYVYLRCSGYMVEHNECNERFRAEAIERAFETVFLAKVGDLEVERHEFVGGFDNTEELLGVERRIRDLEDEYDRGLADDRDRYLARKSRLAERHAKLAAEPVRSPGYQNVGTGVTYSEYWATATIDQRRKLLVDSEILAYAGRSHAFGAARKAMSDFDKDWTPGQFARVHFEPKDLGSVDLNLFMMWRGDLAERLRTA